MLRRGVTLMELVVVVAVLGVVSVLFYSALSEFRANAGVDAGANLVIGVLRDARARTLSGKANTQYGVHFETARTVLFEGGSYDAVAPTNEAFMLPMGAQISNINFGGPTDIIFTRLTGFSSASGTIVVSALRDSAQKKTVSINSVGIIQ